MMCRRINIKEKQIQEALAAALSLFHADMLKELTALFSSFNIFSILLPGSTHAGSA